MLSRSLIIPSNLQVSPRLYLNALVLVLSMWIVSPAQALDLRFGPDLKKAGWRVHTPSGKSPALFDVQADGSLSIEAQDAVAFLYSFVPDDAKASTSLSWAWRVKRHIPATDLSQPGADDRPIAVHVYFSDQNAGLLKRMGRGFAGLFGVPVSGRAITYVWGGQQPQGTMMPNPFMKEGEGVLVIRQSSSVSDEDDWIYETVDLAADYRAAFGEEPAPVSVIGVSADTDDTGTSALSQIKDLSLFTHPIAGVR